MSKLLSPLVVKDVRFSNRIAISPMCMYSAANGFANDWHLAHYGSRAIGGAALIIQEATAVSEEGRITAGDLGLYDDDHIEMLSRISTFVQKHGSVAGIQLAHAGRKAGCSLPHEGGGQLKLLKEVGKNSSPAWHRVAPSAIGFNEDDELPQALDQKGIHRVINDFKTAARRALDAGFKVIEIHGAHGYLVHEFLSPLSNQRNDAYGGAFENRIRFLLEIVEAVQVVWPSNLPLFVRLSACDWAPGGWDLDETVQLAEILHKMGVDLLDCSSGGMVPYQQIPLGPGYQVPFADRIKKDTGILTGAVGLITTAKQAEGILEKGQADLILIGRQSLRDPHFGLNASAVLGEPVEWPLQYKRAK